MLPWQEVKDALSVEEVIEQYVTVVNKGRNFACNCPFHNEKTASLMISPHKQIWHCFGCGLGGDIFAFVSQYENISKLEALKKLAKQANVDLNLNNSNNNGDGDYKRKLTNESQDHAKNNYSNHNSKDVNNIALDRQARGRAMLSYAKELYHQILLAIITSKPDHPIAKYCQARGLDIELIKQFKIGYAPPQNWLFKHLQNKKLDLDLAEEVGLLKNPG